MTRRKTRVLRDNNPICYWCDTPMRQVSDRVWLCPEDGWVYMPHQLKAPICPIHLSQMERLGSAWVCQQGCEVHIAEGGSGTEEPVSEQEPTARDVLREEIREKAGLAKGSSGSRNRGRYKSDLQRRHDEWRRRRGHRWS